MLWFEWFVDAVKVAMRVIEGLYDGVSTSELDNLAAETALRWLLRIQIMHTIWQELRSQIYIRILKIIFGNDEWYVYVNPRNGQYAPLLSDEVHKVIMDNAEF
jgi:ribonucleoside-diphosphate reductase alpha chain